MSFVNPAEAHAAWHARLSELRSRTRPSIGDESAAVAFGIALQALASHADFTATASALTARINAIRGGGRYDDLAVAERLQELVDELASNR